MKTKRFLMKNPAYSLGFFVEQDFQNVLEAGFSGWKNNLQNFDEGVFKSMIFGMEEFRIMTPTTLKKA